MGWAYWANLFNNQLSPSILLGAYSNCWLKNGHVQYVIHAPMHFESMISCSIHSCGEEEIPFESELIG